MFSTIPLTQIHVLSSRNSPYSVEAPHLRGSPPVHPRVAANSPCLALKICKKPFKRPQDLKKHEKIHTEAHHVQHKHSKAITVADPAYLSRVTGTSSVKPPDIKPTKLVPQIRHNGLSPARAESKSSSISDGTALLPITPFISCSNYCIYPDQCLAVPSPRSSHPSRQLHTPPHDAFSQNDLPSWETLPAEDSPPVSAGSKRSHDFTAEEVVSDFVSDMKKRRLTPSYSPSTASRLCFSFDPSDKNCRQVWLNALTTLPTAIWLRHPYDTIHLTMRQNFILALGLSPSATQMISLL